MEGWNPNIGCGVNCKSCYRGWVPHPLHHFPRRDPLIDAITRTDNPCDRPARYPPCCEPVPKFTPPQEHPVCNLENFQEEQAEAKEREEAECCEKYNQWQNSLTPFVEVKSFDPNRPIQIEQNDSENEEGKYLLVDRPVRTNILTGIFNPDDNKTNEQVLQEKCDRFWIPCGPTGLRPYPCRGVIDFPQQILIDTTQPRHELNASICTGTKYMNPEFIKKQYEECQAQEMEKLAIEQRRARNWQRQNSDCYPPGCPTRSCCERFRNE